jgi:outer membrane protein
MTLFIHRPLCAIAVILVCLAPCNAETSANPPEKSLEGYLGAGVMFNPKYTGSASYRMFPLPLAILDYEDTYYIHLDRAGARLWSNKDKTMAFGLAGEPRFGFRPKDGARLSGMAIRRTSIEGGPSFEWETPELSFTAAYFRDLSGASGGQSLQLSFYHQLIDNGPWDVGAYVDFDRANRKIVQYYFGVRADEITATRPYYQPGGTVNSSLGLSGAYKLNKKYALLFGGELNYLGAAAADSPIVEQRNGYMGYIGLGLIF